MPSLRRSWFSVLSLSLYLVVNIGAAALHHHLDGDEVQRPAADGRGHQLYSDGMTSDHGPCLSCQVFHLARTLPVVVRVDVQPVPVGRAVAVMPVRSLCRLALAIHARAPPFVG